MRRRSLLKIVYCGLYLCFAAASYAAPSGPRWADSEVFEVNREAAHADALVFPDSDSARPEPDWNNPYAASSRYQLLNGQWKFQWSENPTSAPERFYKKNFNDAGWDEITVPLPWQLAGYGQLYYFNAALPMLDDPRNGKQAVQKQSASGNSDMLVNAAVPGGALEAAKQCWVPTLWNPVGSYRRTFTVPEEWKDMRTVLHFGGVKSAFTCWVNGREVGYSQDSFSICEFDITDYLTDGENMLAVQVIRWSDGTYQEVQDMIRMSGIFRDVYIVAMPKTYIADFQVIADVFQTLDHAELSVSALLKNAGAEPAAGRRIDVELIDPNGKTVLSMNSVIPAVKSGGIGTGNLKSELKNPLLWHPETPNLYTALIRLSKDGQEEEVFRQDVGFRRFDWDEQGSLFLNGRRYMMRGVNRHDHSEKTGRTISYAEMLDDVVKMRQLNINNVRNGHYPRDIRWYALCNRYGITQIDECNLESHPVAAMYTDPEVESKWREQCLFRMRNLVMMHRNEPSILIWSLGNEQFEREELPVVKAMNDLAKELDPTRGTFCERMFSDKDDKNHGPFLNFIGPMYRGEDRYMRWHKSGKDRRPFFMSEYAHAMGNSMADLSNLWKTFEENPGMNGGQIWDWADQGLLRSLPGLDGLHWTYGGDWGAYGSGRVFCMNGIVLPDRSYTGKTLEAKAVYQQVAFEAGPTGKVRVRNKFAFHDLREFDVEWSLLKNGNPIKSGTLAASVAPLSDVVLDLPFAVPAAEAGCRYDVNFDVTLREPTLWADKGYSIAQSQIALAAALPLAAAAPVSGNLSCRQDDNDIRIVAKDLSVCFDKNNAVLSQIVAGGEKLLAPDAALPGLELNPNALLTDDRLMWPGGNVGGQLRENKNHLKRNPVSVKVVDENERFCRVETVADYLIPGSKRGLRHTAVYTVSATGMIQSDNRVQKIDLADDSLCFRIGIRIPVRREFGTAEYAANGPMENYDERNAAARFGHYTIPADGFFENYVRPQECGNRSGLEWIALHSDGGAGLAVVPATPGDGSVMPWTREEMEPVGHVPELPESRRWILRYDAAQAILPKLSNVDFKGDMLFSYSLRPLETGSSVEEVVRRSVPEGLSVPMKPTDEVIYSDVSKDWKCISRDASLTYSSTSRWAPENDTLLTTQSGAFAFHTLEEKEPWLVIDLGEKQPVSAIEILNRADAQGNRTKNLRIWLSDNQRSWKEVFQAGPTSSRWMVKLDQPTTARYVKIGTVNAKPQFFHLKGVKVFAEADKVQVSSVVEWPNIVIFLVDDMGLMDTSLPFITDEKGRSVRQPLNDWYRTPSMERLAAQGIRFSTFYAHTVCSPSRASILNGQNSARHRTTNWINPTRNNGGPNGPPQWNWTGLKAGDATLPKVLKDAGYRTIHIGKAHFGPENSYGADPKNIGFDVNVGGREIGHPGSYLGIYNYGWKNDPAHGVPGLEKYWGSDVFLTEALTREAISAVDNAVESGAPFFLHMSHYAVHAPFYMDERFAAHYRNSGKGDKAEKFATLIEGMDKSLGDLMDYLQQKEIAENTLIFFLGDNGSDSPLGGNGDIASSAPLRGKKGSRFEGGVRVPFIAAWAKRDAGNPFQKKLPIAEGAVQIQPGMCFDLYPTILEMLDLKSPAGHVVDGQDLKPLLSGKTDLSRDSGFLSHYPHPRDDKYFTSYEENGWKVIYHYLPGEEKRSSRYELYNLENDPAESTDLAQRNPEKLKELMKVMMSKLEKADALYPVGPDGRILKPELP